MTETEHTLAVQRKKAVTRAMARNSSPVEAYSPKRKQSSQPYQEKSPPRYIPTRKYTISQHSSSSNNSRVLELKPSPAVGHVDADLKLRQDGSRERISKYCHTELLRTVEIVQGLPQTTESFISDEKGRHAVGTGKSVTCNRVVTSDNNSKGVQNFKITTNLVPSGSLCTRTNQHKPPQEQTHQFLVSPNKEPRIPITTRLGKTVTEGTNSSNCMILKKTSHSKESHSKFSLRQWNLKDDTSIIGCQQVQDCNLRKHVVRVTSSLAGIVPVLAQTETPQIPRRGVPLSENRSRNCGFDGIEGRIASGVQSREENVARDDITSNADKSLLAIRREQSKELVNVASCEISEDEVDDLDKMIDEEPPKYGLCEDAPCVFPLDLCARNAKESRNETGAKLHRNIQKRPGIRFIVTLDGVDEQQFDSKESCKKELQKDKTLSVPTPLIAAESFNSGQAQQKLLDFLAVQSRTKCPTQPMKTGLLAAHSTPSLTHLVAHPFSKIRKDHDEKFGNNKGRQYSRSQLYYCPTEDVTDDQSAASAIKQAKMMERCKFWPACSSGESCEYHHPKARCKTFPNCKFGAKCLFIHPNCRFDSKCACSDCPYTHASRQPTLSNIGHVISVPPSQCLFSPYPHKPQSLDSSHHTPQTTCRYFPNCQNIACIFAHPKPCRYGLACQSLSCNFYHPYKLRDIDRLKWEGHFSKTKPYLTSLHYKNWAHFPYSS